MTDAELIRRAREMSSEAQGLAAWNTLSQRYLPLVWRYAYALLRHTQDAEDVVSEVMLAFLKNIHQIDTDACKLSAWLRSVVRHKVADHHRRIYRAKDHLPRVAQEEERRNGELQRRDGPVDPSAPLLAEEDQSRIAEILAGLPERQRLALEWKYIEGFRVKEIADRLGETEKAVEATLYRARREFRRLYEFLEQGTTKRTLAMVSPATENNPSTEYPWQTNTVEVPKK